MPTQRHLRPIPILMYHAVAPRLLPGFEKYTVTTAALGAQLRWLATAGYSTVNLDALVAHRAVGGELPTRPVILTFDDGFQNCAEHAVPLLESHGFTATFFLVAGLVGGQSRWLLVERGVTLPLMDWREARQLVAMGFMCGSHSMTHPPLADVAPAVCRRELVESRRLLQDRLGCEVRHLAYPYGSHNPVVRALAAEVGYASACSVRQGLSRAGDDRLALHRIPITGHDSLPDFVWRLRTALALGEFVAAKVHGAWRRVRHLRVR